jgi:hypothetical protein
VPGARAARMIMILVALFVIASLVVGMVATVAAPPAS